MTELKIGQKVAVYKTYLNMESREVGKVAETNGKCVQVGFDSGACWFHRKQIRLIKKKGPQYYWVRNCSKIVDHNQIFDFRPINPAGYCAYCEVFKVKRVKS